jgi:hypothetical protein
MKKTEEVYDIAEHVHRFAAWTASRAASATRGHRFRVNKGKKIIEGAGLKKLLSGPDELPDIAKMDDAHKAWCEQVITQANEITPTAHFTHGIAAKLINIYLKAGLVTVGNRDNERVGALHPPIDRVLLHKLAEVDRERADFWRSKEKRGWTNFTYTEYQEVIVKIREKLGEENRLWMIEEHFQGYTN